jgi:hypothetical protein
MYRLLFLFVEVPPAEQFAGLPDNLKRFLQEFVSLIYVQKKIIVYKFIKTLNDFFLYNSDCTLCTVHTCYYVYQGGYST